MRRNTATAAEALAGLAREHALLQTLGTAPGLPVIGQFEQGHTTTLVLVWPASRSSGVACETLDVLCAADGAPLDPWRTSRLCEGLSGLCRTLGRMHDKGLGHRALTPPGIIMLDTGGLVLRDLGLAATGPQPGEGPANYQAPEQRRRGGRAGPTTDVYQAGAVAYRLITGHLPHPVTPLPVRSLVPDVPAGAGHAIDAALASDPAARPAIRQLGAALRSVRHSLPRES
jgi:serine/threonine protein kinase